MATAKRPSSNIKEAIKQIEKAKEFDDKTPGDAGAGKPASRPAEQRSRITGRARDAVYFPS